jgi:hypothetical protein
MTVGSRVKQSLASLKGIEGTLRTYSVQCSNDEEKEAYLKALKNIESITNDLENRIKTIEFEEPQYKDN